MRAVTRAVLAPLAWAVAGADEVMRRAGRARRRRDRARLSKRTLERADAIAAAVSGQDCNPDA